MLSELLVETLRPYHFRGKLRLLRALTPSQGERSACVFGTRMHLNLGEDIQRQIYLGAFEPRETALVRHWLHPGMTFVDVGANAGYYTALSAHCVGSTGRVFAIEPSPDAYQRLAAAVQANKLTQVQTLPIGLSAERGERTLYSPAASARLHSPTMGFHPGWQPITVPVRRLDDCLSEWGVEKIDLLKIDIEGHETQALRGAAAALKAGRIRAVLCEFNDFWLRQSGSTPQELYNILLAEGFEDLDGQARFLSGSIENRFLIFRG